MCYVSCISLFLPIDFTTVPNGDSGKSGLNLQLLSMETIVTANLIGQDNWISNENALYN